MDTVQASRWVASTNTHGPTLPLAGGIGDKEVAFFADSEQAQRWLRAGGTECGHSACSQNYIDTGDASCITTRVLVVTSGGTIDNVWATPGQTYDVEIFDWDDHEEDDDNGDAEFNRLSEGLERVS